MNLIHLLEKNCSAYADKTVFIEKDTAVPYSGFYSQVRAIACNLREQGLEQGGNVLVLVPLSVNLYAALCAVWALGACVVMFDPSAGKEHMEKCLEAMDVGAFIGSGRTLLLRLVNRAIGRIPMPLNIGKLKAPPVSEDAYKVADMPPEAPALLTFTSGSTGTPKAIVRSHGFLLEQHAAILRCLPYRGDDVDLAVLSVFTLVNMVEGITTVLPRDSLRNIAKVNAGRLVKQITGHGVTRITASPKLMERLSGYALKKGIRLDFLRSVNIGGGPVFLDILEQVAEVTDPNSIRVVYGSTEAEPIAGLQYTDMSEQDRRRMKNGAGLLVGTPTDTVRLKIIQNQSGRPVTAAALPGLCVQGEGWGEIIVSGRHVVKGYLNPEQNAVAKIDAEDGTWHRTGDCGYLDSKGRLWLLGRAGQVIRSGDATIFPFAVESAIRAKYRTACAAMEHHDRTVLVIERGRFTRRIVEEYAGRFDAILPIQRIPLDRRHSSKVDYAALTEWINKKSKSKDPPK